MHPYIGLRAVHTRPGKDKPPISGIVAWIGDAGNSATEDEHLAPSAWLLLPGGTHAEVPLYSLGIHAEDVAEATRRLRAVGDDRVAGAPPAPLLTPEQHANLDALIRDLPVARHPGSST